MTGSGEAIERRMAQLIFSAGDVQRDNHEAQVIVEDQKISQYSIAAMANGLLASTDWSKASDFLSEEKSTRAPGALIQKRTVSTVFVDPTSFSWWLFS